MSLENTNKMLSQLRCSKLLVAVDTSLIKYRQKPQPESREFLFHSEFTKYLKGEVKTDSSLAKVVFLSRHHNPTTMHISLLLIGLRIKFFKGALPGSGGLGRKLSDSIKLPVMPSKRHFPTDPGERADLTKHNKSGFSYRSQGNHYYH